MRCPHGLLTRCLAFLVAVALAPALAGSASGTAPRKAPEPPPLQAKGPREVHVGVYVNNIYGVSLADYRFEADFYIWFRWQGGKLKPLSTFQPTNGRILHKEAELEKVIGGWHYAICRVNAAFDIPWDLHRFPFDTQHLDIEIEDNEQDTATLRYVPDTENTGLDPGVRLPGWKVTGTTCRVVDHTYRSNFGDTSLPTGAHSVWSRFVVSIVAARPGYGYFFKLCWGLMLAIGIALLAMFVKPTDLTPRFGLGTGAIFAAMANAYVISASVPRDAGLTTADKFLIMALSAIALTLCTSTLSLRLHAGGHPAASRRLDAACFGTVVLACVITLVGLARW